MATDPALFVDFGSTFTKLVVVDLAAETMLARVQTPSTVDSDITLGLNRGLEHIAEALGGPPSCRLKLATSSAAGGLRMVAIGLVPDLTVEAAKRAVLGAGAKVVGVYAYSLTERDIREIERTAPDILLLAGGTDGGDRAHVVGNARVLAGAALHAPIIYAGNKSATDEACALLKAGGKDVVIAENVMPEIGTLKVDEVRAVIRELFIRRIVTAKGLQRAERFIDRILMPTPTAVLNAARVIAEGTPAEPGLGDLIVVDIGGATTDVHSVAVGAPTEAGVVQRGLPEPYVKRTVEGDLGVRYNAPNIVSAAGRDAFQRRMAATVPDLDGAVQALHRTPQHLPGSDAERALDVALARSAAGIAMERHAGTIEAVFGPMGQYFIQHGKDLRGVKTVIGTGGPLVSGPDRQAILRSMLYSEAKPFALLPKAPRFYIDEHYLLYAVGLMAEAHPDTAVRVARKHLKEVG